MFSMVYLRAITHRRDIEPVSLYYLHFKDMVAFGHNSQKEDLGRTRTVQLKDAGEPLESESQVWEGQIKTCTYCTTQPKIRAFWVQVRHNNPGTWCCRRQRQGRGHLHSRWELRATNICMFDFTTSIACCANLIEHKDLVFAFHRQLRE